MKINDGKFDKRLSQLLFAVQFPAQDSTIAALNERLKVPQVNTSHYNTVYSIFEVEAYYKRFNERFPKHITIEQCNDLAKMIMKAGRYRFIRDVSKGKRKDYNGLIEYAKEMISSRQRATADHRRRKRELPGQLEL